MARQYSTKDFFRQMPNPLLPRYFQVLELFEDLDITVMNEPKQTWRTKRQCVRGQSLLTSPCEALRSDLQRSLEELRDDYPNNVLPSGQNWEQSHTRAEAQSYA